MDRQAHWRARHVSDCGGWVERARRFGPIGRVFTAVVLILTTALGCGWLISLLTRKYRISEAINKTTLSAVPAAAK